MWHAHPYSLSEGIYELLLGYVGCVWKVGNLHGQNGLEPNINGGKKNAIGWEGV